MSRRFKLALLFITQAVLHIAWNVAWVARAWFDRVDRTPIFQAPVLTEPTRADHASLILYAVARVLFALVLSAILTSWLTEEIFGKEKER